MNNIDTLKFKKNIELGVGMFGTTYLVSYKNKKYALKVQNILSSHRNKNFNYELWRELDLYNYIDKMNDNDKKFFTKLYSYQIYNNCKHKQKREVELKGNNSFDKQLMKLDNSSWCVNFLLEYHGKYRFYDYITKHNLKTFPSKRSFFFGIKKSWTFFINTFASLHLKIFSIFFCLCLLNVLQLFCSVSILLVSFHERG